MYGLLIALCFCFELITIIIAQSEKFENNDHPEERCKFRIAIIGSGISGSSLAYFLTHDLESNNGDPSPHGSSICIDMYEKETRVGGRALSLSLEDYLKESERLDTDEKIDVGGSWFVESQQFMMNLTKRFDLPVIEHKHGHSKFLNALLGKDATQHANDDNMEEGLGIWNGSEFPFVFTSNTTKVKLWTKIISKYGLLSPLKTIYALYKSHSKFTKIYEHLATGHPFFSLYDILKTVDMVNFMNVTVAQYLDFVSEDKMNDAWMKEILDPCIRGTYGPGHSVYNTHALAGFVALAPGFLGHSFYSLKDGADALIKPLLKAAKQATGGKLRILSDENVQNVVAEWSFTQSKKKPAKGYAKFRISTDKLREGNGELYDSIVVATPLNSLPKFDYKKIRQSSEDSRLSKEIIQEQENWAQNIQSEFDELWRYHTQYPYNKLTTSIVQAGGFNIDYFKDHAPEKKSWMEKCEEIMPHAWCNNLYSHDHSIDDLDFKVPSCIFTTDNDEIPFIAIIKLKKLPKDNYIFKIYSKEKITKYKLNTIFKPPSGAELSTVNVIYRKELHAYPYLRPVNLLGKSHAEADQQQVATDDSDVTKHHKKPKHEHILPKFEPAMDVYLTNPMELLISSMETQMMSSYNVAKLIRNKMVKRHTAEMEVEEITNENVTVNLDD